MTQPQPAAALSERPTIWVDVADFLEFFRYLDRPTGIQRAEMELFTELVRFRWPRGAIRFCRLEQSVDRFESVGLEALLRVFHDPPVEPGSIRRRLVRSLRRALRARRLAYWRPAPLGARTESFRRGDILVCLGTSWENPRYIELLRHARQLGVRIAVLIHDIIPVACPGFVEVGLLRRFAPWLDGVLMHSDLVLTNSQHSRATLLDHAARHRLTMPPAEVLRFGTGFPAPAAAADTPTDTVLAAPFVLYVSTIEVRKNHALLLRVWHRLIEKHGAAAVPRLVFIGRVGWLVDDVLAKLSRAGSLSGKVVILSGLGDAEVAAAYRRCLFTVFPSLMEGWGLPVEESLEQGKLCVASDRGAIPEVGGDLIDYFDVADDASALAAIERAIFDHDYRAGREARIHREFHPRSWADCAAKLVAHLDRLCAEPGPRATVGAPMSSEEMISARGLSKAYRIYRRAEDRVKELVLRRRYHEEFWAVRNVDLSVARGETVGLIGRNGSGKSTLLQLICGTVRPSRGEVEVRGRVGALLELGAGFNPEFTGRENVWVNAAVLGLSDREIAARFDAIAAFAGIGEYMDQPVKHYSSGMYARLAFSVCAHVDADILVVDEALSVGDGAFQQKCMRFLGEFRRRGTVLFVSHDSSLVTSLCDRVLWLERGAVRAAGPARDVCRQYQTALTEDLERPGAGTDDSDRGQPAASELVRDSRWSDANVIELDDFDPHAPWYGHGGAVIEDAGFYDPSGNRLRTVLGGAEVELRIRCRAERLLTRPIVGFILRDRLGQNLAGDNTHLSYWSDPPRVAPGQAFTASFRFQMPYLALGDYSLAPSIIEGIQADHIHLQWIEDAIRLHAVESPIRRGIVGVPMKEIRLDAR